MNSAAELHKQFLKNVKTLTGKTADEWNVVLQTPATPRHSDRLRLLQEQYGLPYRVCYLLASHADESGRCYSDPGGLVDAMYKGREALRPIHDALTELVMMLGADVTTSVGKTMVTFRRKHVFAQIKPGSKTRIDFGLALPKLETPKRLIDTGGLEKGDRVSYRIAIDKLDQVDRELEAWLERAYAATAPGLA